jgi:signal transduction histidine kinase
MSIRTRLILILFAFTSIPVFIFGLVILSNARNSLMTVRIAQLNNIADLKKDKIETFFNERESDIKAAQYFYIIKTNLPLLDRRFHDRANLSSNKYHKDLDRQISEFQKSYGYLNVILTNPEGVILYSSDNAYEADYLGRPFPERIIYEKGKKDIYFSDVGKSRETGRFAMMAAAPLMGFDGKFIGEIIIDIDMEPIYRFISDTTGLGATGEVVIAKREGDAALFLSPLRHDPEAALKRKARFNEKAGFPAQQAVQGNEGSGISQDYTDIDVLAAWRYIPFLRWGLVTKIDAPEAFAPIDRLRNITVSIEIMILLSGVLGAIIIARGITRPVLALQRGAEIIGSGDLDYKVGTKAKDEVGHLSRLIDLMTQNLKRSRGEIVQRNQEIITLNEELKHHVLQLEAANMELEAFSYSVSHDLRAPLRSVAGFSQVLFEDYGDKLTAEGRDSLERILSATHRMGRLIDDLLNLSRVSRAEMRREEVKLSELAVKIADMLRKTQSERQTEFIIAEGLVAQGDEHLLAIVLENLLGNAWKFTGKNPHAVIEFGVTRHEGKQAYFVKDNGVGFDMLYAGKMFSPFQRLHSVNEFPGTGIGLATVKRIISRHGGEVWIEGEIDKGTTVYFTL